VGARSHTTRRIRVHLTADAAQVQEHRGVNRPKPFETLIASRVTPTPARAEPIDVTVEVSSLGAARGSLFATTGGRFGRAGSGRRPPRAWFDLRHDDRVSPSSRFAIPVSCGLPPGLHGVAKLSNDGRDRPEWCGLVACALPTLRHQPDDRALASALRPHDPSSTP
jgi:hypothetical protein